MNSYFIDRDAQLSQTLKTVKKVQFKQRNR